MHIGSFENREVFGFGFTSFLFFLPTENDRLSVKKWKTDRAIYILGSQPCSTIQFSVSLMGHCQYSRRIREGCSSSTRYWYPVQDSDLSRCWFTLTLEVHTLMLHVACTSNNRQPARWCSFQSRKKYPASPWLPRNPGTFSQTWSSHSTYICCQLQTSSKGFLIT